ncbi:hypothetical protein BD560DRAFT_410160 [Blakeslea trispora]|nr:hypothetical protein BD560DRAFT_410160 [Blakeslea trispora]
MSVQGFWGLVLHPGKTYSQIVSASFRIAMASLTEQISENKRTTVAVVVDNKEYVLCTLIPNKIEQQSLDHTFVEGEEVTFAVKGDNIVHLTGNYVFTDDDEEMGSEIDSEEGEESDEEFDEEEFLKSLPENITPDQIRALLNDQGDSDDEIDSDEIISAEESEEEEEEEEKPVVNKKRAAEVVEKEQPAKKQKAAEPKKKEEPKNKVVKLPNGLIIEDVKVGDGPSCKSGQRVGMRYIGKLTTGKVFDKNISGKPFNFMLGRGEVIKGWDIGVAGMKVGGERKLTIPAPLAYGKRGAPPDIPKNATLTFDVKLVSMK